MIKLVKIIATLTLTLVIGMSSAWAQDPTHTGTVLETMNSGGYTYVQVKEGDDTFWAAGPQTTVAKGDKVQLVEQMWMSNFKSNTLNRTFDKVMFVGAITKQ